MKTLLFVFGTRPEAIKLAPLIKAFKEQNKFKVIVCLTGQHKEMVNQVVQFFNIPVDINLDLMVPNQTLTDLTANVLNTIKDVFSEVKPDCVFIQGDTTTVMATALAAFYQKIPIAHVEAGLRSNNINEPFPEELNRKIAGIVTKLHFAPTKKSADNLIKDGITEGIHIVGNTVIDALFQAKNIIEKSEKGLSFENELPNGFDPDKKFILVTCHRRENFGKTLVNIFDAILKFSEENPDINLIYPVHKNPNIYEPAQEILSKRNNIFLVETLDYPMLVWLMNKCFFVLTDSGGIQEEAPSFGKPVLVLRNVTERVEAVEAGTAKLVGDKTSKILEEMNKLVTNKSYYNTFARVHNPYGDGNSSDMICKIVEQALL